MNDFKLFSQKMLNIIDNEGNTVNMQLNDQQEYFFNNADRYNMILKPRQLGFTTASLAYCVWMAVRFKNTNYLILSHRSDLSKALFEKLKGMVDRLPRESYKGLFPEIVRNNRDELVFANGSRIISKVATDGVGRGMNLMYCLLSEFAFMDKQDDLLVALEPALQKSPNAKIVIETTANQMNEFYYMWKRAKNGNSKYKPFFFPFYSSAYEKQFKFEIDHAIQWYKTKYKKLLSKDELDSEEKVLFDNGCSLRMLMYRAYEIETKEGGKNKFYQEFPDTDSRAFISKNTTTIFDQAKVLERLNYVSEPLQDYSLPDELEPYRRYIKMYKTPKSGERYFIGVDVAGGTGNDASTAVVLDEMGEEVCMFSSNKIKVHEFAPLLYALGLHYNYAKIAIETNTWGLPLAQELDEKLQYMNLYRSMVFDTKANKRKSQLGWHSSERNKKLMIHTLVKQFETNQILIHSKKILEEMQLFVEHPNGKLGNIGSNNDDSIIGLGLAVECLGDKDRWYV